MCQIVNSHVENNLQPKHESLTKAIYNSACYPPIRNYPYLKCHVFCAIKFAKGRINNISSEAFEKSRKSKKIIS